MTSSKNPPENIGSRFRVEFIKNSKKGISDTFKIIKLFENGNNVFQPKPPSVRKCKDTKDINLIMIQYTMFISYKVIGTRGLGLTLMFAVIRRAG